MSTALLFSTWLSSIILWVVRPYLANCSDVGDIAAEG